MSIHIPDWNGFVLAILGEHVLGNLGAPVPIDENMSYRVNNILVEECFETPSITLLSLSNKLPAKFLEVLPPDMELGEDIVPIYLTISVSIKAIKPVELSCSLILDKPVVNFMEFDGYFQLNACSFIGVLELALYGSKLLFAIKSVDQYAFEISSSFGDSKHKTLQPENLDRFIQEKIKTAIKLLQDRPIQIPY